MAQKRLTDIDSVSAITGSDLLHVVVTGDTSQNDAGSSYKASMNDVLNFITDNISATDVTYNDFYSSVINGGLTAGQWYRITDYRSVNFLNGWEIANNNPLSGTNFNPRQIYTGETEVLVVQAVSNYEISPIGYSEDYPNDIVQYEPYTNKLGVVFEIQNDNELPNATIITNFDLQWDGTNVYFNMPSGYPALFGHFFNVDCEFNDGVDTFYLRNNFEPLIPNVSYCNHPINGGLITNIKIENNGQKIILLDLTENDFNNYVTNTLYVETIYGISDAYGWITRRRDTFRNLDIPFDFRAVKYRRFEINFNGTPLSNFATDYYIIGITPTFLGYDYSGYLTGNYDDFISINQEGKSLGDGLYNFIWDGLGGPDGGYAVRGGWDNNVFREPVKNSKICGKSFSNNTINEFYNNDVLVNTFYKNILNSQQNNNIKSISFNDNVINSFEDNEINSNYFSTNYIFLQSQLNKIFNGFTNNQFINIRYNVIYSNITSIIANCASFQNNIIKGSVIYTTFNSAAIACKSVNSEIIEADSGTNYIVYFNGMSFVGVNPVTG
jgi:hypothetical protein